MRTLRPAIRAHRSKILPRSRTRVWRQEKQEPKTRPAISRLCMALIGLCALTQPDRHPQPTAPSRTSAKGFARPLFEGHFKFCPLHEKMEECTVSKKEASSCHTSNTKLKAFDMTRRRTFEILTFLLRARRSCKHHLSGNTKSHCFAL